MIPELGHFALILALCFAFLQALIPTYGILRCDRYSIATAKPLALSQLFFCLLAFVILAYSFVIYDFSVAYVAQHSSLELPLAYRICAIWGGHEGSMLLWASLLALWTSAIVLSSRKMPPVLRARVIAILGAISAGFLLFILATSNPFLRLFNPIPENGRDLNPLLQDMGFWMHPPILYTGYVGFVVAYAFALSALLSRRFDRQWAKRARPWTLIAWSFLTLGITLGSWWAYRVLGWGGFWFWDPVENASLMPWLLGTGLVHALIVTEKRSAYQAWTLFLALGCFALSLLGTFIVRSGVLTSVHAFAVDPTRGVYMLAFLVVVVGSSWAVYAWRAGNIRSLSALGNSMMERIFSREMALLLNSVLLAVMMLTVLLGTLYPLVIEGLNLGKLSVGAPYFNKVMVPLMVPVFVLMLVVTIYQFSRGGFRFTKILQSIRKFFLRRKFVKKSKNSKSYIAMILAHVGVVVTVVGITMTSFYSVERDVRMAPGEQVTVGKYQFHFMTTTPIRGSNYEGISAHFEVSRGGQIVATLDAQRKFYAIAGTVVTEAAVNAGMFRDFYIALGEPLSKTEWAVRLYYKPFVRWIWFGGLLMMVGGLLAAFNRWFKSTA